MIIFTIKRVDDPKSEMTKEEENEGFSPVVNIGTLPMTKFAMMKQTLKNATLILTIW